MTSLVRIVQEELKKLFFNSLISLNFILFASKIKVKVKFCFNFPENLTNSLLKFNFKKREFQMFRV